MNKPKTLFRLIPVLLAMALAVGCTATRRSETPQPETPGTSASSDPAAPSDSAEATASSVTADLLPLVLDRKEQNPDTVGWLQIPGTSIDDVVVFSSQSNDYYLRKNFEGQEDFNGVYYADFRSAFGTGSRDDLGMNTCIYGHSMTDNPEREEYAIQFGPLHDFRDPDFAREMPYIQFTTEKENLLFEVFAVFVGNSDNPALPYCRNDIPAAEFVEMVNKQILPRSLYNYEGVEISETDKILTLSTCLYVTPEGTRLNYKTSEMRYGVMARLVDPATPLKAKATFTINENRIADPDGIWPEI